MLDPIVKEESIWLAGFPDDLHRVLEHKPGRVPGGCQRRKITFTDAIYENESILVNWASRTAFRRSRGSGNHAPLALLSRI
jgi:hypothetical protein